MSEDKTSMDLALQHLRVAADAVSAAVEELQQLDRCAHIDYPSGAPPVKRCVLKAGHPPPHRYPELSWIDGGKRFGEMSAEQQLATLSGRARFKVDVAPAR